MCSIQLIPVVYAVSLIDFAPPILIRGQMPTLKINIIYCENKRKLKLINESGCWRKVAVFTELSTLCFNIPNVTICWLLQSLTQFDISFLNSAFFVIIHPFVVDVKKNLLTLLSVSFYLLLDRQLSLSQTHTHMKGRRIMENTKLEQNNMLKST